MRWACPLLNMGLTGNPLGWEMDAQLLESAGNSLYSELVPCLLLGWDLVLPTGIGVPGSQALYMQTRTFGCLRRQTGVWFCAYAGTSVSMWILETYTGIHRHTQTWICRDIYMYAYMHTETFRNTLRQLLIQVFGTSPLSYCTDGSWCSEQWNYPGLCSPAIDSDMVHPTESCTLFVPLGRVELGTVHTLTSIISSCTQNINILMFSLTYFVYFVAVFSVTLLHPRKFQNLAINARLQVDGL